MKNSNIIFVVVFLVLYLIWWFYSDREAAPENSFKIGEILGGIPDKGYARAIKPRQFNFPKDHGQHPEFRNEWWYFTGNLVDASKNRFGFQLVFFRNALTPDKVERKSAWASNQTWMAHFALTDVKSEKFYAFEKFSRGAKDLAGANANPFSVWLYNWSIVENNGLWHLTAAADGIKIKLTLKQQNPPLLQGKNGLSQKSAEPGNASYYYSIPRLKADGEITLYNKTHSVSGLSWLDREWSTSALGDNQAGWDWFSLQLSDGSDLMFYRLRRKDGSSDPFSAGTLRTAEGKIIRLGMNDVQLKELDHWTSPKGGRYPVSWQLNIPEQNLELEIKPAIKNQELDLLIRYWEGAVDVTGKHSGKTIRGQGYLELAGYADDKVIP